MPQNAPVQLTQSPTDAFSPLVWLPLVSALSTEDIFSPVTFSDNFTRYGISRHKMDCEARSIRLQLRR